MGTQIAEFVTNKIAKRKSFERRWYNNNYFDDGFHFKTISKTTGRIIDRVAGNKGYVERAIPRASLQIRGVSNLIFSAEPYPVIYPERITIEQFRSPTGQIDQQAYMKAYEKSKQVARKRGTWLTTTWEDDEMFIKFIELILSSTKEFVSFLQVYSDTKKEKILTKVRGAFEVVLDGELKTVSEQSQIAIVEPMTLDAIKSNEMFDEDKVKKLTPDNKYATSEIRNAYLTSRFGSKSSEENQSTILVAENYRKEYLTDENWKQAIELSKETGALEGKSKGDEIMRQTFSAGGVTLSDLYVNYDEYPLIDFRFEPGPLYQTPLIERFIPQNKSLDIIMTRLEKWINTMVVGIYQKRKGENMELSNIAGGQMIEYETQPASQMNVANVGATPFNVIQLLDKYIEEQGASTSALGQVGSGVKSGVAIESLKASEYANLKIPGLMLKSSIKRVAEAMLERAHKDFLKPQEVEHLEDSEPQYFNVVGQRGADMANEIGKPVSEDTIVLKKDVRVRIEMQPGLGITMDGKRESMQAIITFMIQLSESGFVEKEPLKIVIKKFLDTYGFGSTQEFMEAFDEQTNTQQLTEAQITQMKVAIVEAMKDMGAVGPEADQKMVDTTKLGVVEALKDSGMLDKKEPQAPAKVPSESISFKDLPPEGKAQMAAKVGIQLSPDEIKQEEDNQMNKQIFTKKATMPPPKVEKTI